MKLPLFSRKRIKNGIMYSLPLLALLYTLDLIDVGELEEEEQSKDGFTKVGPGEEDEEEEDGLFIPFTWPKEQPRTFYKGSDPEWREFIKFSKNPNMHKEVQSKLGKEMGLEGRTAC
jgi:hypothetical protein